MRPGQRAAFPLAGSSSHPVEHNRVERKLVTWRPNPTFYIVLTALVLRVAAMFVLPQAAVWRSGWEISNVAKSIAAGHGFSSPFAAPTGATAWIPPVYPFLMAAAYKVFGVLSPAPGLVMVLFQVAVAAITCIPIVKLGEALGNKTAGVWAGWIWASYPYFVFLAVGFIWERTLSAFLLASLLLVTVRLCRHDGGLHWAGYGAAWAFAALTNTALLALLPVCLIWLWWQRRTEAARSWLLRPALSIAILLLLTAPWCWRNWKAFGTLVPIRSNFGEELWLGNHAGGRGRMAYGENAHDNPQELRSFQQLGEIQYVRKHRNEALAYIGSHPQRFFRNVLYRGLYWWWAVGEHAPAFLLYALLGTVSIMGAITILLQSPDTGWHLIAFSILVFPLTYYLTDVLARYRHPIEPAMVLVSAYFLRWGVGRWQALRRPAK